MDNQNKESKSALSKVNMKELQYALNSEGKIITELSEGWEPKTTALDYTLKIVEERINSAKKKVLAKKASPILYFMEKNRMDIDTLASCLNIPIVLVKLHLKPLVFSYLPQKLRKQYADLFDIKVSELTYDLNDGN